MGNIVESAFVTNLLDGLRCVAKQMAGNRQAMLIKVTDNSLASMMFEERTECRAVHAYMLSKVINGNVALIVAADEDFYLFQSALGFCLCLFSNLPAITADGDDAQQMNKHCQPFRISQTRHLLQTIRQSLSRRPCENNGLDGFRKVFKVSLQLWECCSYSVDEFRGKDHCNVFYLLPIVSELPAVGCLRRHQNNLATLERFANTGYGSDTLALNNQREFPCRLLMGAYLLRRLQSDMVEMDGLFHGCKFTTII